MVVFMKNSDGTEEAHLTDKESEGLDVISSGRAFNEPSQRIRKELKDMGFSPKQISELIRAYKIENSKNGIVHRNSPVVASNFDMSGYSFTPSPSGRNYGRD